MPAAAERALLEPIDGPVEAPPSVETSFAYHARLQYVPVAPIRQSWLRADRLSTFRNYPLTHGVLRRDTFDIIAFVTH